MITDKALRKLGLDVKEARLYLSLLELGRASILSLARKTKLERVGLYRTIQDLVDKGLARELVVGKKRYWEPSDPEVLVAQMEEKSHLLHQVLPELKAIFNSLAGKPRITYHQGLEGISQIYDTIIRVVGNLPKEEREILQYGNIDKLLTSPLSRQLKGEFRKNRIDQGIRMRLIALREDTEELARGNNDSVLREIRYVPEGYVSYDAFYLVYGNWVTLYTISEDEVMAVTIEHTDQAGLQRNLFNLAWSGLESQRLS